MTTSSSGLFGNFGQCNYAAAKMALVGFAKTLNLEGERHNIRVNCIAPIAATAMTERLLPGDARILLQPDLVVPAALHLVSEAAPSNAIIGAGGRHFHSISVTMTRGVFLDDAELTAEGVAANWDMIIERAGDSVPRDGTAQAAAVFSGGEPLRGPA